MRGKPVNRRKIGSNAALWSALAGLVALAIPCARGAYDGTGTFTKITSRSDLTDGYYVVASSNGLQAMSNNNPDRYFVDTPISPAADVLTDPSPTIVWLIQTNATYGGHTLFNEANSRYVAYGGTVNAAHAVAAVNGTTGVWTFAYGVGAFEVANVATPTRMLQYNVNAPRFACYTTQQDKLTLYKMVPVGPSAPAFGTNPVPSALLWERKRFLPLARPAARHPCWRFRRPPRRAATASRPAAARWPTRRLRRMLTRLAPSRSQPATAWAWRRRWSA